MKKFKALCAYQFKLQMRDLETVFFLVGLPMIFYLVSTYILKGLVGQFGPYTPQDFIIPSYLPIIIANSGVMIFGLKLTLYRERNYFVRYKLLGYKPLEIAVSISVTTLICQSVGIISLLAVAILTNSITIPFSNLHNVLLVILLITLFQFSLGYFLSTILRKTSTYQTIGLLIFFFQMLLGGLTLPPELFGDAITRVIKIINPIVHALYMLRGTWLEGKGILKFPLELAIIGGITVVFGVLASAMEKINYGKRAY